MVIEYPVAVHSCDPVSENARTPSSRRDFLSAADEIFGVSRQKGLGRGVTALSVRLLSAENRVDSTTTAAAAAASGAW